MQTVKSCLHCQFLSHVSKALFIYQNSPKMKLFLQKNAKFSSAGGSVPRPPCLRRLWALPPHPQPPAAGAPPPHSQNSPPIANFWLRASVTISIYHVGNKLCIVVLFVISQKPLDNLQQQNVSKHSFQQHLVFRETHQTLESILVGVQ